MHRAHKWRILTTKSRLVGSWKRTKASLGKELLLSKTVKRSYPLRRTHRLPERFFFCGARFYQQLVIDCCRGIGRTHPLARIIHHFRGASLGIYWVPLRVERIHLTSQFQAIFVAIRSLSGKLSRLPARRCTRCEYQRHGHIGAELLNHVLDRSTPATVNLIRYSSFYWATKSSVRYGFAPKGSQFNSKSLGLSS